MAPSKNLDKVNALPRRREHSNVLVETLELGVLWDEYGLVGDVVVSRLIILWFLIKHFFNSALHGGFPACRYP
jgi:hypothetical protein